MSNFYELPRGDISQYTQVYNHIQNLKDKHKNKIPPSITCHIVSKGKYDDQKSSCLNSYSFNVKFDDDQCTYVFLARLSSTDIKKVKDATIQSSKGIEDEESVSKASSERKLLKTSIKQTRAKLRQLKKFPDLEKEAKRIDIGLKNIESKLDRAKKTRKVHSLYADYGRLIMNPQLTNALANYDQAILTLNDVNDQLNDLVFDNKEELHKLKKKVSNLLEDPINSTNITSLNTTLTNIIAANSPEKEYEAYKTAFSNYIRTVKEQKESKPALKGLKSWANTLSLFFKGLKKNQIKHLRLEVEYQQRWLSNQLEEYADVIPKNKLAEFNLYKVRKPIKNVKKELHSLLSSRLVLQNHFSIYKDFKNTKLGLIDKGSLCQKKIKNDTENEKFKPIKNDLVRLSSKLEYFKHILSNSRADSVDGYQKFSIFLDGLENEYKQLTQTNQKEPKKSTSLPKNNPLDNTSIENLDEKTPSLTSEESTKTSDNQFQAVLQDRPEDLTDISSFEMDIDDFSFSFLGPNKEALLEESDDSYAGLIEHLFDDSSDSSTDKAIEAIPTKINEIQEELAETIKEVIIEPIPSKQSPKVNIVSKKSAFNPKSQDTKKSLSDIKDLKNSRVDQEMTAHPASLHDIPIEPTPAKGSPNIIIDSKKSAINLENQTTKENINDSSSNNSQGLKKTIKEQLPTSSSSFDKIEKLVASPALLKHQPSTLDLLAVQSGSLLPEVEILNPHSLLELDEFLGFTGTIFPEESIYPDFSDNTVIQNELEKVQAFLALPKTITESTTLSNDQLETIEKYKASLEKALETTNNEQAAFMILPLPIFLSDQIEELTGSINITDDSKLADKQVEFTKQFLESEYKLLDAFQALEGSKLENTLFTPDEIIKVNDYRNTISNSLQMDIKTIDLNKLYETLSNETREKIQHALLEVEQTYQSLTYHADHSVKELNNICHRLSELFDKDPKPILNELEKTVELIHQEASKIDFKYIEGDGYKEKRSKEIQPLASTLIQNFVENTLLPTYSKYANEHLYYAISRAKLASIHSRNPFFKEFINSYISSISSVSLDNFIHIHKHDSTSVMISNLGKDLENYIKSVEQNGVTIRSIVNQEKEIDSLHTAFKNKLTSFRKQLEKIDSGTNLNLKQQLKDIDLNLGNENIAINTTSSFDDFCQLLDNLPETLIENASDQLYQTSVEHLEQQLIELATKYPKAFNELEPLPRPLFDSNNLNKNNLAETLIEELGNAEKSIKSFEQRLIEKTKEIVNDEEKLKLTQNLVLTAQSKVITLIKEHENIIGSHQASVLIEKYTEKISLEQESLEQSGDTENLLNKLDLGLKNQISKCENEVDQLIATEIQELVKQTLQSIDETVQIFNNKLDSLEPYASSLMKQEKQKVDSLVEDIKENLQAAQSPDDIAHIIKRLKTDLPRLESLLELIPHYETFSENWRDHLYFGKVSEEVLKQHNELIIETPINSLSQSNKTLDIQSRWISKQLASINSLKEMNIDTSAIESKLERVQDNMSVSSGVVIVKAEEMQKLHADIEVMITNAELSEDIVEEPTIYTAQYKQPTEKEVDKIYSQTSALFDQLSKKENLPFIQQDLDSLNSLISSAYANNELEISYHQISIIQKFIENISQVTSLSEDLIQSFINEYLQLEDSFRIIDQEILNLLDTAIEHEFLNQTSAAMQVDRLLILKQKTLQQTLIDNENHIRLPKTYSNLKKTIDQTRQLTESISNSCKSIEIAATLLDQYLELFKLPESLSKSTSLNYIIPGYIEKSFKIISTDIEFITAELSNIEFNSKTITYPLAQLEEVNLALETTLLNIQAFIATVDNDANTQEIQNYISYIELNTDNQKEIKNQLNELNKICEQSNNRVSLSERLNRFGESLESSSRLSAIQQFLASLNSKLPFELQHNGVMDPIARHITELIKSSNYDDAIIDDVTALVNSVIDIISADIDSTILSKFLKHLSSTLQELGSREQVWNQNSSSVEHLIECLQNISANPRINIHRIQNISENILLSAKEDDIIQMPLPIIDIFISSFNQDIQDPSILFEMPQSSFRDSKDVDKLISSLPSELRNTRAYIQKAYNNIDQNENLNEVNALFIEAHASRIQLINSCMSKAVELCEQVEVINDEDLTMALHLWLTRAIDETPFEGSYYEDIKKSIQKLISQMTFLLGSADPLKSTLQLSHENKKQLLELMGILFNKSKKNPSLFQEADTYTKLSSLLSILCRADDPNSLFSDTYINDQGPQNIDQTVSFKDFTETITDGIDSFSFNDICELTEFFLLE